MVGEEKVRLEYGTQLMITGRTGDSITIRDEGKKIPGEWVEILTSDPVNPIEGVVFDGFLTAEPLDKRFKIEFSTIQLVMDTLGIKDASLHEVRPREDTLTVVDLNRYLLGESVLRITKYEYDRLVISQCFDVSIPSMDEVLECDFSGWERPLSEWEPLQQQRNEFTTDEYAKKMFRKLKQKYKNVIRSNCGASWHSVVQKLRDVKITDVSLHRTLFKIEVEDSVGNNIQNIIEFSLPNTIR